MDDLYKGLVLEKDLPGAILRKKFESNFLQAVCDTFTAMNKHSDWDQFTRYFDLLKNFSLGLTAAMKLRPSPSDYDVVEYHLPLYALQKAMFWPGSLCWYDNHNIYHVPYMMRKWGSLGLVSQEGMEGWQKVLNQVLRMGNGFANAGAIPKEVHARGPEAVKEYLTQRAEGKLRAKWVYDQALMKDYATLSGSLEAFHSLAGLTVTWGYFCKQWERYEKGTRLVVKLVASWRRRRAIRTGSSYYSDLRKMYESYWTGYSQEDIRKLPKYDRDCLRAQRHAKWSEAMHGPEYPRINNSLERQLVPGFDEKYTRAFHALHPCQRTRMAWLGHR